MDAIDLLRKVDEAATAGPWEPTSDALPIRDGNPTDSLECVSGLGSVSACGCCNSPWVDRGDARLIATVRTLLPLLLEELAAGRAIDDNFDQPSLLDEYIAAVERYDAARAALDKAAGEM